MPKPARAVVGASPRIAVGVQARARAMAGCGGGDNGRVEGGGGVERDGAVEAVLQRAARPLLLGAATGGRGLDWGESSLC